jgi:hypothetical protein
MKRGNNILKEAVVLLIATAIVLSTVAIAENTMETSKIGEEMQYETSINTEKYIWDEKNQEWVDADTEDEALDVPVCNNVTFKIEIHNNGEVPIDVFFVLDQMEDSLRYISANPEPDYVKHSPPYYDIHWFGFGIINPCETIEITIIAHVEGPRCSYDWNDARAWGKDAQGTNVADNDLCWVHAVQKARVINTPFLKFLENHPNLFPMLQKLLSVIK